MDPTARSVEISQRLDADHEPQTSGILATCRVCGFLTATIAVDVVHAIDVNELTAAEGWLRQQ
jgi:hypothetical protein